MSFHVRVLIASGKWLCVINLVSFRLAGLKFAEFLSSSDFPTERTFTWGRLIASEKGLFGVKRHCASVRKTESAKFSLYGFFLTNGLSHGAFDCERKESLISF
jgi:hypothetical protein